jgi:hypothetical protein
VPVLAHPAKKPARACARQIADVLRPQGHVLVIGDRPTTDVVLAHRLDRVLRRQHARSGLAIEPAPQGSSAGVVDLLGADTTGASGGPRAFAVLTTHLWASERLGTRLMRGAENTALRLLARRKTAPGGGWRPSAENAASAEWMALALRPARTSEVRASLPPLRAQQAGLLAMLLSQPSLPRWTRPPLRALLFVTSTRPALWLGSWLSKGWSMVGEGVRLGTDARLRSPRFLPPLEQRARLGAPPRGSRGYATGPPRPPAMDGQARAPRAATAPAKAKSGVAGSAPAPSQRAASESRAPRPIARPRPGLAAPPRPSPQAKAEPQPEPLVPPPSKIRGWIPALLALVIIPTGWFAGVALHEYRTEIQGEPDETVDAAPATAPAAAAPPAAAQPELSARVKAEQQAA